jgi:predicted amidohydrolase YtcJ
MLPDDPELIFYNGKVVTIDGEDRISEAFAILDDLIIAVGSTNEVRALAGPDTELIDLEGRTVVPGMIDNHNHQYHLALLTLRGIDLEGIESLAEMLERLQDASNAASPGETLFTRMGGWHYEAFPEQRPPTRQELDQVTRDHPVIVVEERGRYYLNTLALNILGVNRDTPNQMRITYGRDRDGELNGQIVGRGAAVLHMMARVIPPPDINEKKNLLMEMNTRQHAMGLTGIRDLQLFPDVMRAYYELWREDALTMRISMGIELNAGEEVRLEQMLSPWGVASGFGDKWLRLDGIAEFNPGDQLREPYIDSADNDIGELRTSEENFKNAILTMNRYGWRPSIHTQGDRTLDLVLDAFEAANNERSIQDRRWIVEHVPLVHPDQMTRIKRMGVMVSAQYQPYFRAGRMLREWGIERTEQAVPIKDMLDQGIIVSGGSDWPSMPNNPFLIMYYYITRNTLDAGPVGMDQRLGRMQALRVLTLNNAYLTYDEDIKGSIEPGKLADFVILSDDLLTIPEEEIKEIVALATYVGGRKVYSNPDADF